MMQEKHDELLKKLADIEVAIQRLPVGIAKAYFDEKAAREKIELKNMLRYIEYLEQRETGGAFFRYESDLKD